MYGTPGIVNLPEVFNLSPLRTYFFRYAFNPSNQR